MQTIAISDPGGMSVCLSRGFIVQTLRNESRSYLGTQGTLYWMGVSVPSTDSMQLSPNYFGY